MRFDSDLEPGSFTVPEIFFTGWTVSSSTAAASVAAAAGDYR
jgi:hypothetical protein